MAAPARQSSAPRQPFAAFIDEVRELLKAYPTIRLYHFGVGHLEYWYAHGDSAAHVVRVGLGEPPATKRAS